MRRGQWLGKFIQAAGDLAKAEESLLQSMPDEKRKILECKRLKLLEKMIIDDGYPDKTLIEDIAQGFSLVGHAPSSSGVLPSKTGPATFSVSELEEHAIASLEKLLDVQQLLVVTRISTWSCGRRPCRKLRRAG